MDLTKRQQEIFDFIRKHLAKYGYPPTVRDIGKAVGLASSSTVHAHLANLEKIGLLRRDPTKPRAIELLDCAAGAAVESVRGIVRPDSLPLVGSVAAGAPVLAEENVEEYVSVPELAGGGDGQYLLRIRGESMKEAGILEGDYVVVRSQSTARDGDIVVALLGEEATVKRFFREPDHIRLQPENETMEPILSTDVKVIGRVVGLLQKRLSTPRCVCRGRHAGPSTPCRARRGCGALHHAPRALPWQGRSGSRGGREALEESPDTEGQGGRATRRRGNPRKVPQKAHRRRPPSHVNGDGQG